MTRHLLTALAVVATVSRPTAALTLAECEAAALARAPAALAALRSAAAAAAQVRSARAAWWPTLTLHGDYGVAAGFDTAVTNGGQTDALVSLEALILDGGARTARLRAAQADVHSAAAREAQSRADVVFAVRTAYVQAVAAEAAGDVLTHQLAALAAYRDAFARLEAAGLAPPTDVLRARLALASAEATRRAASSEATAAREALGLLTELPVQGARLAEPPLRLTPPTPAMIDVAPIVQDALAASEAARAGVDTARSERATQLRLTADGGALGVQPGDTFRRYGGGQFMLGFALPVFDGGVAAGHIAAAESIALATAARVDEARQTVRLALARITEDAHRADADVAAARAALDAATEQATLMRARYLGGGGVRLLEVLDAVAADAEARLAVPHALLTYRTAVAEQAQVLGGGVE